MESIVFILDATRLPCRDDPGLSESISSRSFGSAWSGKAHAKPRVGVEAVGLGMPPERGLDKIGGALLEAGGPLFWLTLRAIGDSGDEPFGLGAWMPRC